LTAQGGRGLCRTPRGGNYLTKYSKIQKEPFNIKQYEQFISNSYKQNSNVTNGVMYMVSEIGLEDENGNVYKSGEAVNVCIKLIDGRICHLDNRVIDHLTVSSDDTFPAHYHVLIHFCSGESIFVEEIVSIERCN
jgi:hypothetical protein